MLLAWSHAWLTGSVGSRRWLVLVLVTIRGLWLGLYILLRNAGKGEDAAWREEHGDRWWCWSYVQVFLLQGGGSG